jgi:integrase
LGVYPEVSLRQARDKRDEERVLLKQQKDPSIQRKAEKIQAKVDAESSFQFVALEWHAKQQNHLSIDHADAVKRRLEVDLFPDLGDRPIHEIKAPELLLTFRKIEERGAHDLAQRLLQTCGRIFRYGVATGRCETDVAAFLKGALTPHKAKNQNAVKPEQLPKLFQDIASYDQKISDTQTRLALQLLGLTFVRTNELIGATWPEMDLDAAMWSIPAERTKMDAEHLVPLAKQSLAILKQLKTLAGDSKYILPGRNCDTTIVPSRPANAG